MLSPACLKGFRGKKTGLRDPGAEVRACLIMSTTGCMLVLPCSGCPPSCTYCVLVYLCDCLFGWLVGYLFVCLFACLFVCVFVCLLVCAVVRLFVCLYVCVFACLFIRSFG